MPFYIYETDTAKGNLKKFQSPAKVSLAGSNGPIAKFVGNAITKSTKPPFKWHMKDGDLIESLGVPKDSIPNRSIVIDLKPYHKNQAHLYRLTDIWGYSSDDWTPICLRLVELDIKSHGSPEAIKKSFKALDISDVPVFEFLYLRGGLVITGWSWGPIGSVNGVLLWPDPLEFFQEAIGGG